MSHIPWDKYEVALLIEAHFKIAEHRENKDDILRQLSCDLRQKAKNSGIEIDNTFRNTNGMAWQEQYIIKAFEKSGFDRHLPSKMFQEMVELYRNDISTFSLILQEAKKMTESTITNNQDFRKWLFNNYAEPKVTRIMTAIACIDGFGKKTDVLEKDFCSISTEKELDIVKKRIICHMFFRIKYKINLADAEEAVRLYSIYLSQSSIPVSEEQQVTEKDKQQDEDMDYQPTISFSDWLIHNQEMAPNTAVSYVSSLKSASSYCVSHGIIEQDILSIENDSLMDAFQSIVNDKQFSAYNAQQHNRFSAALKKYLIYKLGNSNTSIHRTRKSNETTTVYPVQTIPTIAAFFADIKKMLLEKYQYGFRIDSGLEMMKFRQRATVSQVELPESDDELKREILSAGVLVEGKVYVMDEETVNAIFTMLDGVFQTGVRVVFYESLMESHIEWMTEHHIVNEEILKGLLQSGGTRYYHAKNFIAIDNKKIPEHQAIVTELKRIWKNHSILNYDELQKYLPYIPIDAIKRTVAADRCFVRAAVESYFCIDNLIITEQETNDILDYVKSTCETNGFVSLTDIPLGEIKENNYTLNENTIWLSVFYKVLFNLYYINGKIITTTKSELDAVALLKQYCAGKENCTFDEIENQVQNLTGTQNRQYAFEALYDTMIRIDEEHYVADEAVCFDVNAIDSILDNFIKDRFTAIRNITTFALFPICGKAWNHYLLESYCYRFSKHYRLMVLNFNDKNAGMIVHNTINLKYNEMLSLVAAKAKIDLTPKAIGSYFFETGYLAKSKYSGLDGIAERAFAIRMEK